MVRKYCYFSLLAPILLAGSCNDSKKITTCIGYVEMPQMMKDYFLFQDSSYWVYEDSISVASDSSYINGLQRESYWPKKETGTKDCPCYESYFYNLNSSYHSVQKVALQSYFQKNPVDLSRETFAYRILLSGTTKLEDRFVSIGYDSISPETPIAGGYIDKLDSFKVNGTQFGETLHLYYPSINPNEWVREIYYTRNIGIIKFRDNYDRVWELINYKVKQ